MTGYNDYKFSQTPVGTAENRWADEEEIRKDLTHIRLSDPGRVPAGGMPVISNGDDVWADTSDAHSLIIGATGSKKTRLFVRPCLETLRKAKESVVVTDPKGELYELSADAFRRDGYEVRVLNLRDPDHSDCWNPLKLARDYYREGQKDKAAGVVSDFACSMIPEHSGGSLDPFWTQTSRSILRGLSMMMVENETYFPDRYVNLSMLHSLSMGLSDGSDPLGLDSGVGSVLEFVQRWYPPDSLARMNLNSVVRGSERTFGNICVSYDAAMSSLYIQQSVIELLSCNTVDFRRMGKRPSILFLVTPDEKKTLNVIVSLCVAQLYQQLIDTAQNSPGNALPVRVNFLLDEFSNFPAIPDFDAMISAGRSRNIRFHLVIQGLEQLKSRYGAEVSQTIRANVQNWFFLNSREMELLTEISRLCGSNRNDIPLISPVQLQRLRKDRGECLVLLDRNYPFMARMPDISAYRGAPDRRRPSAYPVRDKSLFAYRDYKEIPGMINDENSRDSQDWLEDLLT